MPLRRELHVLKRDRRRCPHASHARDGIFQVFGHARALGERSLRIPLNNPELARDGGDDLGRIADQAPIDAAHRHHHGQEQAKTDEVNTNRVLCRRMSRTARFIASPCRRQPRSNTRAARERHSLDRGTQHDEI